MNNTLILIGAAAFFIGALFAWLITRYQAQSRHFIVLQELAESRRLHEFAEQVQAQTAADLAQSRHTVQELQDALQETGNRFAAAEKQIAYLQDCEAEAEALKHECAKWQQSAQNLQINNERLNTQLAQEQALSAYKNTLLQQQETEKGRLKQDYDTLWSKTMRCKSKMNASPHNWRKKKPISTTKTVFYSNRKLKKAV